MLGISAHPAGQIRDAGTGPTLVHSGCPGLQHADRSTRPRPAIAGLIGDAVASCGVFALAEGAVGDLAQQEQVVVQGADIAFVDFVGAGVEMVVAEGLEAREHEVDLALGGEEGVPALSFVAVARRAVIAWLSLGELRRFGVITIALTGCLG